MEPCQLSCADCGSKGCINSTGNYPPFCTTAQLEEGELEEALALAEQPENRRILQTAAVVEYEGYCRLAEEYPDTIVRVDCSGTKFETKDKIVRLLRARGLIG